MTSQTPLAVAGPANLRASRERKRAQAAAVRDEDGSN
jgi:hypothetical protein